MAEETTTTQQEGITPTPDATTTETQTPEQVAAAAAAAAAGTTENDPFGAFDEATREWVTKRQFKDVAAIAKTAYEQEKMLGNAIRVPGKDAKPEDVEAYLNKLGRPETADGYDFTVPKDLPETLPYDAERAPGFKALAHGLGLTAKQAAAIHDWAVGNAVDDFKSYSGKTEAERAETAKSETGKLEKLWGPLTGEQMKTNLAFADKFLKTVGGEDALKEFQRVGLIGTEGNVILSAPIAAMMAKAGAALYTEDQVLTGKVDRLNNPFAEGSSFNVTAQMKIYKEDREQALAFIAAAGKKPSDFGLKG